MNQIAKFYRRVPGVAELAEQLRQEADHDPETAKLLPDEVARLKHAMKMLTTQNQSLALGPRSRGYRASRRG